MTERNTKVLVATRLSVEERSALENLARTNDRPIAREVRRAILRHLQAEAISHAAPGGGAT